ncbi:hypothetical protein LCGC14_3018960, partial [marine sediment metagenome]
IYGSGSPTALHPFETDKGITTRDRSDIQACDILLVNAIGITVTSVGTAIELGWADAFRKPIVMVLPKKEQPTHPFNHGMVREITGYTVENLDEGLYICQVILQRGQ